MSNFMTVEKSLSNRAYCRFCQTPISDAERIEIHIGDNPFVHIKCLINFVEAIK